ncbi:MAG: hypothetical protein KDK91_30010, partial [Gammaproteobacteria bacterium]|nr:hypothetical protein [Gammaproteobacteria bacterium]
GAEHVAHQARPLALMQHGPVAGRDPSRILPAMLKHRERIVKVTIDVVSTDNADYSAVGDRLWVRLL